MIYRASNRNRAGQEHTRCAICGTTVWSASIRSLDRLCLICRAAVLDRIFQARNKETRSVKRS
jgi:hypothetical protein